MLGAYAYPARHNKFGSTAKTCRSLRHAEARIHVIYPYFFNLPLYASNINANGAFTHISNFIKVILLVTAILCNYLGFGVWIDVNFYIHVPYMTYVPVLVDDLK